MPPHPSNLEGTNEIPMKRYEPSELIINEDNSIFHLHIKPEQLADRIILVGDPGRVDTVASHFDSQECSISNREFHTITGLYKGKRITVLSTSPASRASASTACSTTMPDATKYATSTWKRHLSVT